MPELSIIIVHYRAPGFLKMCLDSARKSAAGINHELIVVDSAFNSESRDIVNERMPEAIYLPFTENIGYSRGVNAGLSAAKGEYILVLNPDIIVTEGNLQKLLSFAKKRPDIGLCGPQLRNFNGTIQQSIFRFYKPLTVIARRTFLGKFGIFKKIVEEFTMSDVDLNKVQTPDWIMGSALLISREALKKVGPMDERFFMYFEDVDWARRFWHNGYKVVYYPGAVFYHYHVHSSKSRLGIFDALFNKQTHWHISSAIKFFRKYRNLSAVRKFT